jgi:glutamate-1-semialdehyde 2,1-aminomutase
MSTHTDERIVSKELYKNLKDVIPGGVNSPVRSCPGLEMTPLVVDHAMEDMLVDADGEQYIDFCMSWGALIHGHAHPQITENVIKRIEKGSSFGCTTAVEERLARKVRSFVPSCELIRFVSSGTEATMSAVRLARGYTKKNLVIKFSGNYHGHTDSFLVQAGSGALGLNGTSTSLGIPQEFLRWTACLPYNDIEALENFLSYPQNAQNLACIIVEPVATNMGLVQPSQAFLEYLRRCTKEHDAVLLFDEVVTGFRLGSGGAQSYFGIEPDLTCLGKILGGGFPAAAFGGKKEIMENLAPLGQVYQAGTLSGNPVAMEAGYQSLSLLDSPGFYENLQEKTKLLIDPIQEYFKKNNINCCIQSAGSLFTIFLGQNRVGDMNDALLCDKEWFNDFFRYLFAHGIYIPPSQHEVCSISQAHTNDHLEYTRDLVLEYFKL